MNQYFYQLLYQLLQVILIFHGDMENIKQSGKYVDEIFILCALLSLLVEHHCGKHFNATFVLEKPINIFTFPCSMFREDESYSSYYFFYVKELKELKGTLRNLINCFLLFFYPLKFTQIGFLTIKELFSHHFFFFYFIYTLYLSQIPLAAKNILLLYNWIKTCFNAC